MMKSIRNRSAIWFGAGVAMVSVNASAALPAVIGTTITEVQTDALAAIDLVWPFVLAVTGGLIIMKIVKRVLNKA